MYSSKEFRENLNVISAIKDITTIYQEIASMKVKQLRENVAKTRDFLNGIGSVYNHAKISYLGELQKQIIRGKIGLQSASFIKRNGKKVLVLLSANEHLYGSLILDIWRNYIADLKKGDADAVIVGSVGRYFLRNEKLKVAASFFPLNDDKPKGSEIKRIIDFICRYEQIIIYYGEIISVMSQYPTKKAISGGVTLGEKVVKAKSYLFEPSPEKIMEFFETEIIAALFNQTVYEHELARFAARMVAMDQATENANETLTKLNKEWRSAKRAIANSKQLGIFAGYSLWGNNVAKEES